MRTTRTWSATAGGTALIALLIFSACGLAKASSGGEYTQEADHRWQRRLFAASDSQEAEQPAAAVNSGKQLDEDIDAAVIQRRLRVGDPELGGKQQDPQQGGEQRIADVDAAVVDHQLHNDGEEQLPDRQRQAQQAKPDARGLTQDSKRDAFARSVMEQRAQWRGKWQQGSQQQQKDHEVQGKQQEPPRDPEQQQKQQQGHRQLQKPQHAAQNGTLGARSGKLAVSVVVGMTVAMAGAAGLGALPFFFVRSLSRRWSSLATAVACGVMFAASFDLIHEGQPYGGGLVVFGIFLGGVFIAVMQRWLDGMQEVQFGALRGTSARRMVLMVGIMAAHAVGEGCGVGVSFCGERGWAQGVLTTLAIGVHNVPEGLAKATVLVSQGATAWQALVWSMLTCLPQPLVAVPAFVFVEAFTALLPIALGFAAGCMIWMVFAELLPDALKDAPPAQFATAATLSAAGLEGLRMAFESLEGPDGSMRAPLSVRASLMSPVLAVMLPALAAGAIGGGLVSGSTLPPPLLLGFAATVAAACALAPLLQQFLWVPPAHTLSGAAVGAVLALLLRRRLLVAFAASRRINGSIGSGNGYSSAKPFEDVEEAHGHVAGNGSYVTEGELLGVDAGAYVHTVYSRRPDGATNGRPSQGKGKEQASRWLPGRDLDSKGEGRWSGPSRAAGVVAIGALVVQGVPLGWHLALNMLLMPRMQVALQPAVLALLLRGLAAGGAARAALGRSGAAGAWLGGAVGASAALATALAVSNAPADSPARLRTFSYPQGLTETAGAVAAGAVWMGALMMLAVGMSMHARRARLGVIAAALGVTALYAGLGGACHMGWLGVTCNAFSVLQ